MELVDATYISSKGGSLRAFAQIKGGPRGVSPNVEALVRMEEEKGYNRPDVYRSFARAIDRTKSACRELLAGLTDAGKKIAGYGASATTTTLTYHFELGAFLDCIVDDNPIKQFQFSPGLHLPVLPRDGLKERKIDVAVILAWNYAEPIMKSNSDFLHDGGQFLIPMPNATLHAQL